MSLLGRVLRNLRSGFPSRFVVGRISPGEGPAELVSFDEIAGDLLNDLFPSAGRGSVIYRDATKWTSLSPGTSGQHLRTNGAGADPTWETPSSGSGGMWAAVETVTATSAAQIDIDLANVDRVTLKLDMRPVTDAVSLRAKITDDAFTSVEEGTNDYEWSYRTLIVTGTAASDQSGTPGLTYMEMADLRIGNLSGETIQLTIEILKPQDTSRKFTMEFTGVGRDSNDNPFRVYGFGSFEAGAQAVNGIRFFFSSGNIASATIKVYNLVNPA